MDLADLIKKIENERIIPMRLLILIFLTKDEVRETDTIMGGVIKAVRVRGPEREGGKEKERQRQTNT